MSDLKLPLEIEGGDDLAIYDARQRLIATVHIDSGERMEDLTRRADVVKAALETDEQRVGIATKAGRLDCIVQEAIEQMNLVPCTVGEYHLGLRAAIETLQIALAESIECNQEPKGDPNG